MNIFYAPPSQINNGFAELTGQEAIHASKVMRVREGDRLVIVDGEGRCYEGPVRRITKKAVQVEIEEEQMVPSPEPSLILGMGIIKKRDRLEFAVEKAVELGASQICLFRSAHTIKENVRMDRLESIALSAMKQSLRAWLPEISLFNSFEELLRGFPGVSYLAAHEKVDADQEHMNVDVKSDKMLLLVGPEGGFAPDEIEMVKDRGGKLISLGSYRLRAETAAAAFLSQFLS
ncbi:MAG TPA: RsmE family RNA methyltransferase [Balneolaceae bacterium]|nr:RsmE family RNA methyltransferase [Balneolaceae bacterium]